MKKLFDKHITPLPRVPAKRPGRNKAPVGSGTVALSFETWLQEVALDIPANGMTRHLTTDEMIDVSIATVRESTAHRHWPKDVVEKFLAADLICTSPATEDPGASKRFASLVSNFLGLRTKSVPQGIALNQEVRHRAT